MEKEIILRSAKHSIETGHHPSEDPGKVKQIISAGVDEIMVMRKRKNMHLPLIATRKRLDSDVLQRSSAEYTHQNEKN